MQFLYEFAGKEFTGYKGQKAVKKLLKEEEGYIQNAFYRKDIGQISLMWGNKEGGLKHIVARRSKKYNINEFLKDFSAVLLSGKKLPNKKTSRLNIWDKKRKKMIVLETTYGNKKINWPITEFEQKKRPK
ncbi:MAG: hypothetical protein J6V32_06530 [Elusimicrobiaceae bacterium]|nr:hypothetical protein [Elusimicrobiaceae bacterium]